ncbi:MAG: OmpA family protein [Nitrospirota bacterium]
MKINMKIKSNNYFISFLLFSGVIFLTGCATKSYVEEKIAPMNTRVEKLEIRTTDLERTTTADRDKIGSIEKRLPEIAGDARGAKFTAHAALKKIEGLKIAKKVVLTNSDVRFNFNNWLISKAGKAVLDNLARELAGKRYSFIVIAGHTDHTGTEEYNLYLGRVRAEAAASYLATKEGIDRSRIIVMTFGKSVPVASNKTKEGREQNRRVEITVYDEALE